MASCGRRLLLRRRRGLQPGDVVRPQEHPAHVDFSLRRPTERAPGWGHHTKSPRRLIKEAYAREAKGEPDAV